MRATRQPASRAVFVFMAAAVLTPVWLVVGGFVSRPDARGIADGPEGSWYWPLCFAVLFLSFVGCACAPLLSPQTLQRKITFAALAILAFIADVGFSVAAVWVMFGFVD